MAMFLLRYAIFMVQSAVDGSQPRREVCLQRLSATRQRHSWVKNDGSGVFGLATLVLCTAQLCLLLP